MDQTEDNGIHEIWQKRHKILHERRLKNKDRDAPAWRSHPDLIPSWAENKFDRSGATLRNNNKITEILFELERRKNRIIVRLTIICELSLQ